MVILALILSVADLKPLPSNWYESISKTFDYCMSIDFSSSICPTSEVEGQVEGQTSRGQLQYGEVSARAILNAKQAYLNGLEITDWLSSLNLDKPRPAGISERLWDEVLLLYAENLYDRKRYQEAMVIYDRLVDRFRMRASFHQKRAWIQYRAGNIPGALGSLLSAESPLLKPYPFAQKYFLKALIERDLCRLQEAYQSIQTGRVELEKSRVEADQWPWVQLCDLKLKGSPRCQKLREAFKAQYENDKKQALRNLDLLEVELVDKIPGLKKLEVKKTSITWPMFHEHWIDEVGKIYVPVDSQCAQ